MTSESISASVFGNREFELHLHVLEHRHGGSASRYTIGIWEHAPQGAALRAICHIRPLAAALVAIGEEFARNARPEHFEIAYPKRSEIAGPTLLVASDAPSCGHCGSLTRRNGSCFICENCGASTGCS